MTTEAQRQRELLDAKADTRSARRRVEAARLHFASVTAELETIESDRDNYSLEQENSARRAVKLAQKDISRAVAARQAAETRELVVREAFQQGM